MMVGDRTYRASSQVSAVGGEADRNQASYCPVAGERPSVSCKSSSPLVGDQASTAMQEARKVTFHRRRVCPSESVQTLHVKTKGTSLMSVQEPDGWHALASEVGRKIGRSPRPVAFLLGAGASLSSGGPDTTEVTNAFEAAT